MANAGVKITANSQDYQNKMTEMVASMKSLGSEFSLTATQAKLAGDKFGALKLTVEGLTQKVELQKNIVKANTEQIERLSKSLETQKTKHDEIAKKVDAAKKAYNESAVATGKNSEESLKLKKTLDDLNNNLTESERRVSIATAALDKQKAKTDKSNVALLEMGNSLKEVAQKLKDAKLDEFAEKCDKVAKSAENVAKKTALISGAAAGIEISAAKSALTFEDAMSKVSTIADTSVVSYDDMKQAIIDLSNETGIAAGDIADNVYNAISAGQETGDAVNFVREATKLATAGFTESSDSLDILTTILNAYGLEASEVGNVSDQLITTQNLGKTTVGELAGSMGKVIPTAKSFNVGLDNVNTSYVKMTANGIKTTESTTYLNAMLNEIGKTGSITDQILREKTGKSFSDLMASGSSLGDVLAIVEEEANAQNKQFSDMFSSSEAAKAGLVLIKDGADGFNETLGQMNNSSGATDSAFEKMQTTSFKIKITFNEVKNALIDFGTSVLEVAEPAIAGISTKIKELTTWFKNLDKGTKENIVKAGMFVAAIAPIAIGISKVAGAVKGAINMYKSFKDIGSKVMTMLKSESVVNATLAAKKALLTAATKAQTIATNLMNAAFWTSPITWIVVGIVALIAAVVLMYNKCEWFRNMINEFFEWIKPAFAAIGEFISSIWSTIVSVVSVAWTTISGYISIVINIITSVISAAFNFIGNVISVALGFIWIIISTVWNLIYTTISTVINTIVSVISVAWNTIYNTVMFVWNIIATTISIALNTIFNIISTVFEYIRVAVEGPLNVIGTVVSNIFNGISSTISSVMNGAKDIISNAINAIKGFFNFNIQWPDIKLPHFNITGSFNPIDWITDGLPNISVDWYANGGIMTSPTMFGMNGNRMMVGGEAGAEAILPLAFFYQELSRIIDAKLGKIKVNAYFKVDVNVQVGNEEVASKVAAKVNEILAEEYEGAR